jgi:hypothetical protein
MHPLLSAFLASINIRPVTVKMGEETRVGLDVKYPLVLSSFNENYNVLTKLSQTFLYRGS